MSSNGPKKSSSDSQDIKTKLGAIVGASYVLDDPSNLESYGQDWTRLHKPAPSFIVKPKTTEEVSQILAFCQERHLAVVPSGGRTGLAGGAVAQSGEIVLSLDRMNKILNVDKDGLTISVEAGVTTEEVQDAARDAGLSFPLDLAAKGSCQIGGNIATNAGGVKFIRYGGMREQVLGLEVVLMDGKILNMNSGVRKNNTGYDLKQLFIGSEGTLGIVTKATLKLAPPPADVQVAMLAVNEFGLIPQILGKIHLSGAVVTACEFFTKVAHEIVLKHSPAAKTPFEKIYPFYVLLEVEQGVQANTQKSESSVIEIFLEKLFEENLILDAVVASTPTEARELWSLRENITESIAAHGHARKNDISLSVADLGPFIKQLSKLFEDIQSSQDRSRYEAIKMVLFGHIGDGNLHINYVTPKSEPFGDFQTKAREIEKKVFALLPPFQGSISAEHGIGLTKKKDLSFSRTDFEVDLMRKIKKIFDPNGLMNPGKIFDL